jgi:hypothetical protein
MFLDHLQEDKKILNNSCEKFKKEYLKNKSKMNDYLFDFLIKNYKVLNCDREALSRSITQTF